MCTAQVQTYTSCNTCLRSALCVCLLALPKSAQHSSAQVSSAQVSSAQVSSAQVSTAVPKSAQHKTGIHTKLLLSKTSSCARSAELEYHIQAERCTCRMRAPGCLAWFTCEPCDHQSVSYNVSEERRLPNQNFCLSCEIIVYFVKKRNNKTVESRSYEMLLLPLFLAHLQDAWPEALQVVLLGMVRGAV